MSPEILLKLKRDEGKAVLYRRMPANKCLSRLEIEKSHFQTTIKKKKKLDLGKTINAW